jgi:uncharacterized protein (TIGR03437 family)
LATVTPGIFSVDSTGAGQGVVLITSTGQLAAPGTPVSRGQYVTIYCSGLGAVSNPPASGSPAGGNPLSKTVQTTLVFFGQTSVIAEFAGLAPGFVGLYQVNALVPTSVTPGPAVPLSLNILGIGSNPVTIAVQ